MSNNSSVQSSQGTNINDNNSLQFETLLNNPTEWTNNPVESTRQCLKYLYSMILHNNNKIDKLDRVKATKNELNSSLNIKANIADIMRTFSEVAQNIENRPTLDDIQILLDEKANRNDVNELMSNRPSLDDIKMYLSNGDIKINLIEDLSKNFVTKKEFSDVVSTKANKDNVINALHKKGNKSDFDNVNNNLNNVNKRLNEFDNDLDRFIDNVKKQFNSINQMINNLTSNKVDYKEIENFMNNNKDNLNINRNINNCENDIKKLFNNINNITDNLNNIEKRNKELFNNLTNNNNETNNLINMFNDKINKITEQIMKLNNDINSNTLSHKDLEYINKRFENLSLNNNENNNNNKNISYDELNNMYKTIENNVNNKIIDSQNYMCEYIKNFDNDIKICLDKKANINEMNSLLNNKADINTIRVELDRKLNRTEFENMKLNFEKMSNDYINKIDYSKFDNFVNNTNNTLNDIKNELMLKANINEMIGYLKNKAEIDDINKALNNIHDELDNKPNIDDYNSAMDNQNGINMALIQENTLGKWLWNSGDLKNGYAVPWEVQYINTNPENFIWEKDSISILVNNKGIYMINCGFFTKDKPTIQVLINGEMVLSQINSNAYVIKNDMISSDDFNMSYNNNNLDLIDCRTGMTLCDYLNLEDKSRVTISYSGSNRVKGFLSLTKIAS